ncbi:hypothetical protein MKW98_029596 [Papaver atlanticum]|uniref:Uncharacterized protein n=1 Tax=Papaver atlanticum TaxID=357466 RepID=A0AAD4XRD6_9MAGN|nr:hypothetical protein MKW98_029596 [Papaver atlanticum]
MVESLSVPSFWVKLKATVAVNGGLIGLVLQDDADKERSQCPIWACLKWIDSMPYFRPRSCICRGRHQLRILVGRRTAQGYSEVDTVMQRFAEFWLNCNLLFLSVELTRMTICQGPYRTESFNGDLFVS